MTLDAMHTAARLLTWSGLIVLALVLAVLVAAQLGLFTGRRPGDLGVRDGRLKPPSATPNSVSSQAELYPQHPQLAYARIAPLPVTGDGAATMARLRRVVEGMRGARVIESRPDYLYAEFTTPRMKYVDDVEFWLDPAAGAVQVRSASRLGGKDYGVNRARIEAVRRRLAAAG